jgi:Tfp pilus assembly protein PilX
VRNPRERPGRISDASGERGTALVMAIFVLALLTAMAGVLLFITETEVATSRADVRSKVAFFNAEAGLEDGRETLRVMNLGGSTQSARESLNDELTAATGANGTIDFDPAALRPVYAADGGVSGFTGSGDDLPLKAMTTFGSGRYAAFLTNDAVDGRTSLTDTNNRVMITAIGTGPGSTSEVVQAIVERVPFPSLPATITIMGPTANFDGGNSNAKTYTGNDCPGGVPGLYVPVVGVIGAGSVTTAQAGVHKPGTYSSGPSTGTATVSDVDGTIDPVYKSCQSLLALARQVRAAADLVGNSSTPNASLGTPSSPKIVFIDGDYVVQGGSVGAGLLWVTGNLSFSGNAAWTGVIFSVGKGYFERNGSGNGTISGGTFVANISGSDRILGTADDCSGQDGISGTIDDGSAVSTYTATGGGTGETRYCSTAISDVQGAFPYMIVDFRQR